MTNGDSATPRHVHVPSQHTRVVFSWLSIFPLVTLGMTAMSRIGPIGGWPIWLRALLLTVVVVPTSMYLVVPRLLVIPAQWSRRRVRRDSHPTPAEESAPA
ncbi:hypothetical protein [Rhodococcus sp. HNM0569]|uniref:hypothetical protein n=1 Tax=Rhodococcus sp. HNM0569 TaxID=2716340 RepID=UPI00146EF1CD|nr:hypothetical protein [Rhodococcus sp. HNM0569]NLU82474.1 hypothetical protein [Rhodococcus sp. HNM0569]